MAISCHEFLYGEKNNNNNKNLINQIFKQIFLQALFSYYQFLDF